MVRRDGTRNRPRARSYPCAYVLVPVDRLDCIEAKLDQLISKEESMAAEQSAEAKALDEAIAGLDTELQDVGSHGEIVTDLEGVQTALSKVNPVSPEQVNAVTAATSSLASLTAKLKAAGEGAAAAEAGAGTSETGGLTEPTVAAPTVTAISLSKGPLRVVARRRSRGRISRVRRSRSTAWPRRKSRSLTAARR